MGDFAEMRKRSSAVEIILMEAATAEMSSKRANAAEILLALSRVISAFGMTLKDGQRGPARDVIGEAVDICLDEMDEKNELLRNIGGVAGIAKMAEVIAKERGMSDGVRTVEQIRDLLAEARKRLAR